MDLPWGCRIAADIRETVGRSLWTTGVYDLAVTEILFRLTDPGSLALDVGANIGVMTGVMASRGAEVWSLEPFPSTHKRLRDNIARLDNLPNFGRCTAFELAASDIDGAAPMECPEGFAENNGIARIASSAVMSPSAKLGAEVAVKTSRLDSILQGRKVGVMKIDVEGHEPAVLRGATHCLDERRVDHIVFEEHGGSNSPACTLLADKGYTLFQIGWKIRGPVLGPLTAALHRWNEAPSYLATRFAAEAVKRCSERGWRSLRKRNLADNARQTQFEHAAEIRKR